MVANAARGIELETFHAADVVRIQDWIVNEIPAVQVYANNGPKLGRDASRFPVPGIDAELEIQSVKELVVASVRTDEELADLEAVDGCAVVRRVETVHR